MESASEVALVEPHWAGKRLDAAAAQLFSAYSRSRLQIWINDGYLTVDGQQRRCRDKLVGGEELSLSVPAELAAQALAEAPIDLTASEAQSVDFPVVFEDEQIMVIDKPAGLVMHPAPGNRQGTLLNGLLERLPQLVHVPRAGIVHRLDKDTTGLCVVAKTLVAHTHLVRQLQERSMGRSYTAVAIGEVPVNGTIDAAIGRHPRDRKRMAVLDRGKPAVTHFQCAERYDGCARLDIRLETGRTHQIRVHLAHIGHSLLGDRIYGRRLAVLPRQIASVAEVAGFSRQALHAYKLTLQHPGTAELLTFETDLPDDMKHLCLALADAATVNLQESLKK
ncbi:MAG: RluA family pseudouridine synthase [Granulosicoccus sp.]